MLILFIQWQMGHVVLNSRYRKDDMCELASECTDSCDMSFASCSEFFVMLRQVGFLLLGTKATWKMPSLRYGELGFDIRIRELVKSLDWCTGATSCSGRSERLKPPTFKRITAPVTSLIGRQIMILFLGKINHILFNRS